MIGPTKASELLRISAFSMSLNLNIKKAAKISIPPDNILNKAMPITAFSINVNIRSSSKNRSFHIYMQQYWKAGQGLPTFFEYFTFRKK